MSYFHFSAIFLGGDCVNDVGLMRTYQIVECWLIIRRPTSLLRCTIHNRQVIWQAHDSFPRLYPHQSLHAEISNKTTNQSNFNGCNKLQWIHQTVLSSFKFVFFLLLAYRGQRDIVIRCSRPVKLLYVRNKLRCKKKRKSVYPSGRSCFRGGGLERYLTDVRARYKYWGRVHRFTVVFLLREVKS